MAFLCTDLEFYDNDDLSQYFFEKYLEQFNCILTDEDQLLWQFYKLYRANIKVKVNVLKAMQAETDEALEERTMKAQKYFKLFQQYFDRLTEMMAVIDGNTAKQSS